MRIIVNFVLDKFFHGIRNYPFCIYYDSLLDAEMKQQQQQQQQQQQNIIDRTREYSIVDLYSQVKKKRKQG